MARRCAPASARKKKAARLQPARPGGPQSGGIERVAPFVNRPEISRDFQRLDGIDGRYWEDIPMTVKVASDWLSACSGCEISIMDMGERLLDVLAAGRSSFTCRPSWTTSTSGRLGEGNPHHIDIPEADVGIHQRRRSATKSTSRWHGPMRERCGT
jgi:hypothetical protein